MDRITVLEKEIKRLKNEIEFYKKMIVYLKSRVVKSNHGE